MHMKQIDSIEDHDLLEVEKIFENTSQNKMKDEKDTDIMEMEQLRMEKTTKLNQIAKVSPMTTNQHNFKNQESENEKVMKRKMKEEQQVSFDEMNDMIQEMSDAQYQHMYHLQNLMNINCSQPSTLDIKFEDQLLTGDMKITDMFPVVSNGNIFSVLSIICHKKSKSLIVILKYNKDSKQMEQIYEKLLINNKEEGLNCISKLKSLYTQNKLNCNTVLGVKNGDNVYFSAMTNETEQVSIQVWKYDFKQMKEEQVYERKDKLKVEVQDFIRTFYATSCSLSIYYQTGKDEKIMKGQQTIDEDEFMKNTYLTVDFRTKTNPDNQSFQSQYRVYRLSEFNVGKPQISHFERYNENTEQVFKQFVIGQKFYNSEVVNGKTRHESIEIGRKEEFKKRNDEPYWKDPVSFSKRQDAKSIDKDHHNQIESDFRQTFSIFSERSPDPNQEYQSLFNSTDDKGNKKFKILVEYQIQNYKMIDYYDKLAEHLKFKPGDVDYKKSGKTKFKSQQGYQSMNVIYNLEDKEVYVMAAIGKMHQINIMKLSDLFLKKKEMKYLDLDETIDTEKDNGDNLVENEVKNEDITVSLKVSQTDGIFMLITTSDKYGMKFFYKNESKKNKMRILSTKCVGQHGLCRKNKTYLILINAFKESNVGECYKTSSTDIITINPVSMNLFALKEQYRNDCFQMKSLEHEGVEIAILNDKRQQFKILIKNNEQNCPFKSDISDSNYMIYYDSKEMKEDPQILQVHSTLNQSLSQTEQNPYLSSFHMINSMQEHNNQLSNFIEDKDQTLLGVFLKTDTLMNFLRRWQNKPSLDQIERQCILQQQIRTILNMAPIDYENLIYEDDQISILTPIEQLNCQSKCDFILKFPTVIKHVLQNQYQTSAQKHGKKDIYQNSLIKMFLKTQDTNQNLNVNLTESMQQLGLIRNKGELITDLFLCNSLEKCFITKTYSFWQSINCCRKKNPNEYPKSQTAAMLIDHMLNGKYDKHQAFFQKNIMLAASNSILDCDENPYPFKNFSKFYQIPDKPNFENKIKISFFQNLDEDKAVLFNDCKKEINMVEQRTYSPNISSDFNKGIALKSLINKAKNTPQELKVFPVKNVVIDMQPFDLQTKISNFRQNGQVNSNPWNPFINQKKIIMISEYMDMINNKFYLDIKNHIGLQKIIETQFVETHKYFLEQTIYYSLLYALPLLLQMFIFENPTWIVICMVSCLSVTLVFTIQEWIEFQESTFWNYITNFLNLISVFYYSMFYVYFYFRVFKYLDQSSIPLNKFGPQVEDISNVVLYDQFVIQILSGFQLVGMAAKLMEVIRFTRRYGKIVELVNFVLFQDVMIFFQFFVFWIIIFSFAFQILGNNIKTTDKDLNVQLKYFIHSWGQAIRSGIAPNTDSWRQLSQASPQNKEDEIYSTLMILMNWAVQFFNEFFMRIVLLSFLIGLVGRSLAAHALQQVEGFYQQQSQMNREASLMWRFQGQMYETGMFVLSADLTKKETVVEKTISELKNEIQDLKNQNKVMHKLENKIEQMFVENNDLKKSQ